MAETAETGMGFTVSMMEFEVAGLPEGQVALDVRTQVTMSLLASEASVNVADEVPAFTPFFFHW